MSRFTAGFRTMESQANSMDSRTLLRSGASSPEVWEMTPTKAVTGNGSVSPPPSYETDVHDEREVNFSYNEVERGPVEAEEGDSGTSMTPEFPDWRRSAILTVFIFPPTGLIAMALACLSHSSAQKGDYTKARRLNCCSCWLIFISLLLSISLIAVIILLRIYGQLEDPF